MDIKAALGKIAQRQDLTGEEMRGVMNIIMSGEATPSQIGAFLMGLRVKGETVGEIAAAVSILREKFKPSMLIGGRVGKDNREVDDFCHDTVSVSAIPRRIVIRRGKRNIDEMPVCCIPALRTDLIRPRRNLIKTMMSVQRK